MSIPGHGGEVKAIDRIDLEKVSEYAAMSMDIKQIVKALDIGRTTFYNLMKNNVEFREAYEKGVENRKYMLEQALIKRAEGFSAEEVQVVETDDPEKGIITKKTVTTKNYVPDTTALIFALKNLYPDRYKDRTETVTDININVKAINQIPDEQLMKLAGNMILEDIDYEIKDVDTR